MIRHLVLLTAATASTAASAQDLPARLSVACRGTTTYTTLPGAARAEPWTHRMESERTWVFDREAGTAHSRLSAERAYCSEGDVCYARSAPTSSRSSDGRAGCRKPSTPSSTAAPTMRSTSSSAATPISSTRT